MEDHTFHGPMPGDDYLVRRAVNYGGNPDHADANYGYRQQIQHSGGAPGYRYGSPDGNGHLQRRSDVTQIKQYNWWQKQGNNGEEVGSPDIRNINWKDDGIINKLPWKRGGPMPGEDEHEPEDDYAYAYAYRY
jgi:hypothetical protein